MSKSRHPRFAILLACGLAASSGAFPASADESNDAALADTLSGLIREAIPREYDKQKDWGATKEIVTGIRPAGKLSDLHVKRHKKTVNHGVWKHYKLRMIEPEKNLVVRVSNLDPLPGGRMGFAVHLEAKLDAWARATLYEYGVHIISLEMASDARVQIDLAGEVGLQVTLAGGAPGIAVQPVIKDARLKLADFHLRRVSDARGPVIHQLGDGLRNVIEEEINGPQLVAKLNQAIEKKRDRLTFSTSQWLNSPWSPLSQSTPTAIAAEKKQ
jgi:hypothetical protein